MKKAILSLLVIGFIIYTGILFGAPHYSYYVFKSDMEELAGINLTPKELMSEIMSSANDSNIPIRAEDVSVFTTNGNRRIQVSWNKTVNFFDLYKKRFFFSVDTRT